MAKFEKVNRINEDIKLPERSTKFSAGYDFYAIEDILVPGKGAITYVKTGVKAKLAEDEFLMLCNRSSNPKKKELVSINGVGVVDSDYYGNPDNDGEIGFEFYNISDEDVVIKKGEKVGQGLIVEFIKTENDYASNLGATRTGGWGSTRWLKN